MSRRRGRAHAHLSDHHRWCLGEIGREAFSDFRTEANGTSTVLTGELDQAALYGTLNRILSLGFELVALSRLPADTN